MFQYTICNDMMVSSMEAGGNVWQTNRCAFNRNILFLQYSNTVRVVSCVHPSGITGKGLNLTRKVHRLRPSWRPTRHAHSSWPFLSSAAYNQDRSVASEAEGLRERRAGYGFVYTDRNVFSLYII